MCILLRAPQYSTFACCLIPVLTLVVLLVMLDDIDDISFSKRRYFLIVSWMSISVYCIPTRDTHITRDMCMGIHISRGYTYHCDTGRDSIWYQQRKKIVLLSNLGWLGHKRGHYFDTRLLKTIKTALPYNSREKTESAHCTGMSDRNLYLTVFLTI